MRAIIRQAKANLGSRRLQSALTLLTLAAAATLLTVSLCTLRTAQGAYGRLFERTNGAHVWLRLRPDRVTADEAVSILSDLPGVEATTAAMRGIRTDLFVGEERERGELMREWPDETVVVARPLVVAGRPPQPGESDVIVLDRNAAVAYRVEVGDTIGILTPQGRRSLTVVGLSVGAELCPYPSCFPVPHYLAPGAMARLGLLPTPEPDMGDLAVGLRLRDPAGWEAVVQAAERALPAEALTGWFDWQEMQGYADSTIQYARILLITFSVVAGLAAGFLIANTVSGAILGQTRQIGLLKAVGFTRPQLALTYLAEYLGVALVASLIGVVGGGLLASLALRDLVAQFGEALVWPPLWIALVTPLSTLLVATLFILLPVIRAARLNAIAAIRTGVERPRRRAARLPRLSPPLAIGVSETLSRPLRSALVAVTLGTAVVTLTAGLTLGATFRAIMSDPRLGAIRDGELVVARSPYYLSDQEVRELIAAQPEAAAVYTELWGSFQFPGEEEGLNARYRDGDMEAFQFALIEGRMIESTDEVVVGYALAEERDLQVGDSLGIVVAGEPVTVRVVGIYRESTNRGRMAVLPLGLLRRLQPDAEPYLYVVRLHPDVDRRAVATALTSASTYHLEVTLAEELEMPDWLLSLEDTMVILSLLLTGMAAVGTFSSVWMSVRERNRDLALLKAVGVTPGQVTLSVLVGTVLVAVVGYAIGLPVGLMGISLLMDMVTRGMGFGPLQAPVNQVGLALLLPGVLLVSIVSAALPAHRAGQVSVVQALRYE
jgi:putative ABC transport system permease protein